MSFSKKMRAWHRDIGYFVIGLTIVYAISGIILSGRGLGWFALQYSFEKNIEKNLKDEGIIKQIPSVYNHDFLKDKLPSFLIKEGSTYKKIEKVEENNEEGKVFYAGGKYIIYKPDTGVLLYEMRTYPPIIKEFNQAHMSSHKNVWFYLAIFYSIALLFLVFSSLFMVKGKYGIKQRGLYIMLAGIFTVIGFIALL